MQNEMLLALINQKTVGITVVLQGQKVVTYLKALQHCNNSGFHAYISTEEEVWSYLNLRDQYVIAAKEERSMVFHLTSQFLDTIWYVNSYFEGNFWKGRTQLIVVRLHVERVIIGYEQWMFALCIRHVLPVDRTDPLTLKDSIKALGFWPIHQIFFVGPYNPAHTSLLP